MNASYAHASLPASRGVLNLENRVKTMKDLKKDFPE
jgi:hypothetical protein